MILCIGCYIKPNTACRLNVIRDSTGSSLIFWIIVQVTEIFISLVDYSVRWRISRTHGNWSNKCNKRSKTQTCTSRRRVLEEYENMTFSACWDYTDHWNDWRLYELWHERCERNKDIIFSIIICIIYI